MHPHLDITHHPLLHNRCWYENTIRSNSVVVITSALHAEGRGFNPHLEYFLFFIRTVQNHFTVPPQAIYIRRLTLIITCKSGVGVITSA